MTQAHLDMSLANGCIYCENLLSSTVTWLSLETSTLDMYNQLKEEVELYGGVPLCLHCQTIINRKINLLKRIDPSLENVLNTIQSLSEQ